MAAEVERDDAGVRRQRLDDALQTGLPQRAGEAVRDDHTERLVIARTGQVHGCEPLAVAGLQRQPSRREAVEGGGHSAILASRSSSGSGAQRSPFTSEGSGVATRLLLTNAPGSSADVLPTLGLLGHTVRVLPLDAGVLVDAPPADVVILDARHDLVAARSTSRVLRTTGASAPLIAVVTEGGLAAVAADWGLADVLLDRAGPAEGGGRADPPRARAGRGGGGPRVRLALGRVAAERETNRSEEIRSGDLSIDEA